jgi:hypothetical protein
MPRHRRVAWGIVIWPLVSGAFFGLVATVLALRGGGAGRAIAIGALVGGAMFAANAIAVSVAQAAARTHAPKRPQSDPQRRTEARAS